jgi:hypothetical protein
MSCRFVKITDFYPVFLAGVYEDAPGLSEKPYEEQLRALLSEGFGWADFFSRHLVTLGMDAHEIVMNAERLQRAWAHEHDVPETATLTEILWKQLEFLNPEVIFFENPMAVSWEFLRRCREKLPNIRCLIGWCACPFTNESSFIYSLFDLMLTSGIRFIQDFSAKGIPVRLMRHGFETSLLDEVPWGEDVKTVDITFIGSFFAGKGFHDERWRFFKELLLQGANIALYTDLPRERLVEVVEPRLLEAFLQSRTTKESVPLNYGALADFLEGEGHSHGAAFCRQIRKPVFGKRMFAALAQARIGIHVHPDVSGNYTGGMRPFEVTGVGASLLTDWKEDLSEIFAVGEEVMAFRSTEEAQTQIAALLENPEFRQAMARAGQEKTLSTHTYRHRTEELAEHIADLFAGQIPSRRKFFLPPASLMTGEGKRVLAQNTPGLYAFLKRLKGKWIPR